MSMQGHMQREKKACHLVAAFCLTKMKIMYERSRVSGLSACIPGEGVADSMPNDVIPSFYSKTEYSSYA
jgi:hypothetical protein